MSMSKKAVPSAKAKGRAQFLVHSKMETVEVQLDRQGFRRLLQSLEQLAETGERQVFDRSGRRRRDNGSMASDDFSVKQLTFSIEQ